MHILWHILQHVKLHVRTDTDILSCELLLFWFRLFLCSINLYLMNHDLYIHVFNSYGSVYIVYIYIMCSCFSTTYMIHPSKLLDQSVCASRVSRSIVHCGYFVGLLVLPDGFFMFCVWRFLFIERFCGVMVIAELKLYSFHNISNMCLTRTRINIHWNFQRNYQLFINTQSHTVTHHFHFQSNHKSYTNKHSNRTYGKYRYFAYFCQPISGSW